MVRWPIPTGSGSAAGSRQRPLQLMAGYPVPSATTAAGEPDPARPADVPDAPSATTAAEPAISAAEPVPAEADSAGRQAITAMYSAQYRSLVRMSAVLVGDVSTAEEVVQDSFIATHGAWRLLRDTDMALPYLRRSVVHRSQSVLRRRVLACCCATGDEPALAGQEPVPIAQPDPSAVISTLRALPARQQEALVLRFYLDLPEGQVASAMGISLDAARRHTARGMAALRSVLELEQ